jgi:hypothetical protein
MMTYCLLPFLELSMKLYYVPRRRQPFIDHVHVLTFQQHLTTTLPRCARIAFSWPGKLFYLP